LGDVAKGLNPKAERSKAKAEAERERADAVLTFAALVDEWASMHLASRRPRYAAEAVRAIRTIFAGMMLRPASKITRADAVNSLDRLVKAGKATTAARVMAYARAAYSWAYKRGKVASNPFQGLPIAPATTSRERVLSDVEVSAVWEATEGLSCLWRAFYRIALLTLQRRQEVAGMRWSELSDDRSLWTIPGSRMKNGKSHDVHLSQAAQNVLCDMPRRDNCDFVFSSTGRTSISGFSKAKVDLDGELAKLGKPLAAWVLHDFRRTGVTALVRQGFDSIICDKLLAHQPVKLAGVAGVYQRHDFATERARALDFWAAYVTGAGAGDNVVALAQTA
jgi:integrase